jgi:ribosome-binding ATPase YchF (GTP1/OBG family)
VVISAKIEEEIAQLEPDEAEMFLTELGLDEAGPRPDDPRGLRAPAA